MIGCCAVLESRKPGKFSVHVTFNSFMTDTIYVAKKINNFISDSYVKILGEAKKEKALLALKMVDN